LRPYQQPEISMTPRRSFEDAARPAGPLERQLIDAARKGDAPTVDRLIRAGANFFADAEAPLQQAAENGHLAVVMLLVEQGSLGLSCYQRPMFAAERNGHTLIAGFLKTALQEHQKTARPGGPNP
jgi:hypothetical protein